MTFGLQKELMPRKIKDIEGEEEIIDEKKILKEAEEREKERKAEEEQIKEEQKEAEIEAKDKRRKTKAGSKTILQRRKPKHGKKYRQLAELIEKDREYPINEAIELVLQTSPVKFDATIEVHVKINGKEKNTVRGTVKLPGGVAKEKLILAVTEKNVDDVLTKVKEGKIDFNIMVADLKLMPKLAQAAKILGPKGLMPSPKAGTAVENVEEAVEDLKGGKIEYRADKLNIVHQAIGRISFGPERIKQNYDALLSHLPKRLDSIYLTTSMGPSIRVAKK